jgi:hypothetical protein
MIKVRNSDLIDSFSSHFSRIKTVISEADAVKAYQRAMDSMAR